MMGWYVFIFKIRLTHHNFAIKYLGKCLYKVWFHFLYGHLPSQLLGDTRDTLVWDATWHNMVKPMQVCVAVET